MSSLDRTRAQLRDSFAVALQTAVRDTIQRSDAEPRLPSHQPARVVASNLSFSPNEWRTVRSLLEREPHWGFLFLQTLARNGEVFQEVLGLDRLADLTQVSHDMLVNALDALEETANRLANFQESRSTEPETSAHSGVVVEPLKRHGASVDALLKTCFFPIGWGQFDASRISDVAHFIIRDSFVLNELKRSDATLARQFEETAFSYSIVGRELPETPPAYKTLVGLVAALCTPKDAPATAPPYAFSRAGHALEGFKAIRLEVLDMVPNDSPTLLNKLRKDAPISQIVIARTLLEVPGLTRILDIAGGRSPNLLNELLSIKAAQPAQNFGSQL